MRYQSLLLAALLMFAPSVAKAQRQEPGVFTRVDSGSDLARLYPESRADSEKRQKADAEMAKKYYKHGVEYGRMGLFPQAAAAFEIAVNLNPSFGDAYYGLGHAYFDLRRWQDAERALRQALRLKPRDRDARMMLDEISTRLRQRQDQAVLVSSTADRVKESVNHSSQDRKSVV